VSKRDDESLLEYRLRLLRRPYSDDTTPEAQQLLNKIIREMPERQRTRRFAMINHFARERMIEGFLHREPSLTRREAELRVIRANLGDDLFEKVYGPDAGYRE
jgi:hypothetical protein